MITLAIFIAVLAVLVLSHEFGHFIVARKNGMKVEEFGFGFPPRLLGIRKVGEGAASHWQVVWGNKEVKALEAEKNLPGGTIYSFNWLPLGGFVKIKGEDGGSAPDTDSFASKKPWQKASVLVAGVAMNIVTAVFLLSVGFMIGLPQAITGEEKAGVVRDARLNIIQVLPGKPAEAAGLKPGDIILEANELIMPRLKEFQEYVNTHRNQAINLKIERDKAVITKSVQVAVYADTGRGGIGVAIAEVGTVRYPWYQAIYYGSATTIFYLKEIIIGFALLIKGLFTGAGVGSAVSGPVGVAVMTGQVARLGFAHLIQFTALLSLNLAVLNILPVPALDGGRLLFVVIGKIIRRPVTPRLEQIVHTAGFAFLMLLVVAVTIKDLTMFSGFFKNIF